MDINSTAGYAIHLCICALYNKKPQVRPDSISFEAVYKFSKSHMVECLAYYGVQMLDEKVAFWEEWTKHITQQTAADAVQHIEFDRFCEKFENENIGFIPLKGFALKECYPQSDMRRMSDLDIYVNDENAAHEAMLSLGYTCEQFGKCHHNTYYLKPVMNVEIHKELSSDEKYSEYFSDICKKVLSRCGSCHADFNATEQLIYIVYHIYKHFSKGGCGVRVIFDLYLYSEKHKNELDFDCLYAELEKIGIKKFYYSILSLAKVWFESKDETLLDKKLADYIFSSGAYGLASRHLQNMTASELNNAKSLEGAKVRRFFLLAFPNYDYMKKNSEYVRKLPLLLPVAYIHRAIRAMFITKKGSQKLKSLSRTNDDKVKELYSIFKELEIL